MVTGPCVFKLLGLKTTVKSWLKHNWKVRRKGRSWIRIRCPEESEGEKRELGKVSAGERC